MAGRARLTASAVVGTSGKPQRIWGYSFRSGAGGPGVIKFYNGTAATDTEVFATAGSPDDVKEGVFGQQGKFFGSGCFISLDSDVSYVEVEYEQVQS